MNRNKRILWGGLAVAVLLLIPSCATVPGSSISVDAARESLQVQYPGLLRDFDLHLGTFTVRQAAWEALSPSHRTLFLNQCARARWAITGGSRIEVRTEGEVLATFDGRNAVFYGGPLVTGADARALDAEAASIPDGSPGFPKLVFLPHPIYPPAALQAGLEGTVMVRALISPDGRVRRIELVDGGISIFNPAAVQAVRDARFGPYSAAAAIDSVWVRIPMRFALSGHKGTGPAQPEFQDHPQIAPEAPPLVVRPTASVINK